MFLKQCQDSTESRSRSIERRLGSVQHSYAFQLLKNCIYIHAGTVLLLGSWRGELKSLWFNGDSLDQFPFHTPVRSPTD